MTTADRVVITPTARLARNLLRQQAAAQAERGMNAWLSETTLTFPAWVARLRERYLLDSDDPRVPIDSAQALALWQSLIDRDVFIGEPRVATLAQGAWRLIHEYMLVPPERWPELLLSVDSRRFRDWAAGYRRVLAARRLLDEWAFAAELPALVGQRPLPAPAAIVLNGFDLPLTPLQQRIIDACVAAGTVVTRVSAPAISRPPLDLERFETPDDELTGAARWARTWLEQHPTHTIAIVVPDLAGRVDQAERCLRQVFDPPGFALETGGAAPWHVSLGRPLAAWPIVTDALAILDLAAGRLTQPEATRLLRSPFVAGWAEEHRQRATTLGRLAARAPYDLTLAELRWALERDGAAALARALGTWQSERGAGREPAWPSQWAARFQRELSRLGFALGRTLDSREYQVLARWHGLLESLGALDLIVEAPLSRRAALELLTERAAGIVFREQNREAPVEVLGVEEAVGSRFDALWITTLDDATWPGTLERAPLVPAPLQAAVPRATADGCLERARQELAALLAAAPTVRGSLAEGGEDTRSERTRLLDAVAELTAPPPSLPAPAPMDTAVEDCQAPALDAGPARGGTGVLRHQASCPFRAFAEHRLGARDLKPPRPGLDAGERGDVVHRALDHLWRGLGDQAALAALSAADRSARVRDAVARALDDFIGAYRLRLSTAGRLLEQRRTERVLGSWLTVELARASFEVIEQERELEFTLGGLTLAGKIDRLDRLADGGTALIDYKTGRAGRSDWFPEPRMADPQLPAYALALDPPPSAVVYARLRPDMLAFDGLAGGDAGTPGVDSLAASRGRFQAIESWPALLTEWRATLEGLAGDFRAGRATVDPRRPADCVRCHLHALCRIQERAPLASLEEDEAEDE